MCTGNSRTFSLIHAPRRVVAVVASCSASTRPPPYDALRCTHLDHRIHFQLRTPEGGQPMHVMSREEWRGFISAGGRTGKLATVRPDGRPHVVPVWFVLDGEDLVFTTWHTSVKAVNLRRDPR